MKSKDGKWVYSGARFKERGEETEEEERGNKTKKRSV